jgi:uncharacterized membrane protein (DUF485 family)
MERPISGITVGVRELFRILVPGLIIVAYLKGEFPLVVSAWSDTWEYILILALFSGLCVYASRGYRWLPPWRRAYRFQINRLGDEVKAALGGMPPIHAKDYASEYKHFLEIKADRSFAERIHYFTSFYYLIAEVSELLAVFMLVELAAFVVTWLSRPLTSLSVTELGLVVRTPMHHLVYALLFAGGVWLFHRFGEKQFKSTIDEEIITVKANHAAFESIQRSLGLESITESLVEASKTILDETVLDPNKRDYRIECERKTAEDWRTGREMDIYSLKIYTAYPLTIGGSPGGYKGYYQERLEAHLSHLVSLRKDGQRVSRVSVEVIPTTSAQDDIESLVPINKAYEGIIVRGSPVDQVAERYHIHHVLVRGRHLVGPTQG